MKTKAASLTHYLMLIILLGGLAFSMGLWLGQSQQKPLVKKVIAATILPAGLDLNPFNLQDYNGAPFNNASLKANWTFLLFGSTHCGNQCVTTLISLKKMYQQLINEKIVILPKIVLVSVDSNRDTPVNLKQYLSVFNKNFLGVAGNGQTLAIVIHQLIAAHLEINKPLTDYQIKHGGSLMLINPDAKLAAIFVMPTNFTHLAKDYITIINNDT